MYIRTSVFISFETYPIFNRPIQVEMPYLLWYTRKTPHSQDQKYSMFVIISCQSMK